MKSPYNSMSKKKKTQSKNGLRTSRHLSIEEIWWHVKRSSTLLIIREMQIKATMRYHHTSVRIAVIQELMLWNCRAGEDSSESLGLQGDSTSPF